MYLLNYGVKYDWFLTGFIKFLKVHAYPALVFPQTLRANFVFWFFNGIPLPSYYLEAKCVREREREREREHAALESILSFTPSVRSQATE